MVSPPAATATLLVQVRPAPLTAPATAVLPVQVSPASLNAPATAVLQVPVRPAPATFTATASLSVTVGSPFVKFRKGSGSLVGFRRYGMRNNALTEITTARKVNGTLLGLPPVKPGPLFLAHHQVNLPLNLDDGFYYESRYYSGAFGSPYVGAVPFTSEGGKHDTYGGYLRGYPKTRTLSRPIGSGYILSDAREEVRRAKAVGLDGFSLDVLNLDVASKNYQTALALVQAASEPAAAGFTIVLKADMSTSAGTMASADFAQGFATLAGYSGVYRLPDGTLPLMVFMGIGSPSQWRTAQWWSDTFAAFLALGINVKIIPQATGFNSTFTDLFDAMPQLHGYSYWGDTTPGTIGGTPALKTAMRARSGMSRKSWTWVARFTDNRAVGRIFSENAGFDLLIACMNQAMANIDNNDFAVELLTWSDWAEMAAFGPNDISTGTSSLDIARYYMTKIKTGSFPVPTQDRIDITHRPMIPAPTAILNQALSLGTAYTSVIVLPVTAALAAKLVGASTGSPVGLLFYTGARVMVTAAPNMGDTTLTIQSYTPSYSSTTGSVIGIDNGKAPSDGWKTNDTLTFPTWSHVPLDPNKNYEPMVNTRNRRGSINATATEQMVTVRTVCLSNATLLVTVGGVQLSGINVPAGETITKVPAAVSTTVSAILTRGGTTVGSCVSPLGITDTPVVQDMSYVTSSNVVTV